MPNLNKHILQTIFVQVPNVLFGIIAGIFITRQLGPANKGIYTLFFANSQLLLFFLGLSINQGIVYFISQKVFDEVKVLKIVFTYFSIMAIIGFSIVFFNYPYKNIIVPSEYNTPVNLWFLFLMFFTGFLNMIFVSFLQAKKKFNKVNFVVLLNSCLNLLVFSFLFFFHHKLNFTVTLELVFICTIIISFINLFFYFFFFLHALDNKHQENNVSFLEIIKKIFKYVFITHLAVFVNFFNYRISIWFITNYVGDEAQLGYYSLALSLAQMMLLVTNAITVVLFPTFSDSQQESSKSILGNYSRVNALFIFCLWIFLFFNASWIIKTLYGTAFTASTLPFKYISIGYLCLAISLPLGTYLASQNKVIINLLINLISLVFTVMLNYCLIQLYGIIGSAIANSIGFMVLSMLTFVYARRNLKFNLTSLLIIKKNDCFTIIDYFYKNKTYQKK